MSYQDLALGIFFGTVIGLFLASLRDRDRVIQDRSQEVVAKLKVGAVYVLDRKDPFCQTRAIIRDINCGYVSYRFIYEGLELGTPNSMKAAIFAATYEPENPLFA